jgi:hypothetical protein
LRNDAIASLKPHTSTELSRNGTLIFTIPSLLMMQRS